MINLADPAHSLNVSERDFVVVQKLLEDLFDNRNLTVNDCSYADNLENLENNWKIHLENAIAQNMPEAADHAREVLEAFQNLPQHTLVSCLLRVEEQQTSARGNHWAVWIDLKGEEIVGKSNIYGEWLNKSL